MRGSPFSKTQEEVSLMESPAPTQLGCNSGLPFCAAVSASLSIPARPDCMRMATAASATALKRSITCHLLLCQSSLTNYYSRI